ncbi:probable DNA-directed RNA polymerase III subunit RPC6 [Harpegnathos saltator]|uniref:DNA-directed RNA polymerase III subunit RPC6 n=1 Tax=Harpegnathos saltator TaxID=610380 RepID=E2BG67_HARSA|nr:probable DNA-directed RNA polymerase III subunit RPC6 [Harpegnathos saltator]EFN85335.1 DNA-directed RNA polymerase III subunit RPC6 [Harpegnathos saltator]
MAAETRPSATQQRINDSNSMQATATRLNVAAHTLPNTIEQKIISLAKTRPKGISDKDLATELPDLQPFQRAQIINKLLTQGCFELLKQGESLFYRLKDLSKTKAVKGADNEEKIVYTIIEEAGNKGIWIRDIRFKSNLAPTQLNKILKSLETKKCIKAVKSVAASKKKVYMLYSLEPDRSVTGGAWYQDQDFETEFVDILTQSCYTYLNAKATEAKNCKHGPIVTRNMSFVSSKDVHKYITHSGVSKVVLSVEDIEMLLNALVYDGKIEKTATEEGNFMYRAIQPLLSSPGLIKAPCGICPVRKNCSNVGEVTPIKCEYITKWLEFGSESI